MPRVRLLRRMRRDAIAADPGFDRRINAVAFPYSFSSALDMRLAGLRAIGHAREARGWLLARSVPRPEQRHELEVYWHLGSALLGLAKGDGIEWPNPGGGVLRVRIEDVLYQPERAGDFRR